MAGAASRGRRGFRLALVGLVLLTLGGVVAVLLVRRGSELNAGIAAYRASDLADARDNLAEALSDEPDNVTALVYLARIDRRERRFQDAANRLSHAASVAPDDPVVRRELGHLLLQLGRPASAARQYELAVQWNPGDIPSWIGYIRALRASGDSRAEQMLERAPAGARAVLIAEAAADAGTERRTDGAPSIAA